MMCLTAHLLLRIYLFLARRLKGMNNYFDLRTIIICVEVKFITKSIYISCEEVKMRIQI